MKADMRLNYTFIRNITPLRYCFKDLWSKWIILFQNLDIIEARGYCSFCLYKRNCWPSLFKPSFHELGPSWPWTCGSWIYNYLYIQCLSPLTLWVRTPLRRGVFNTTLCDKVCQWLAAGQWFSPGTPGSSTNKTDRHDIAEILLKVALNTITLTIILIK